MTDDYLIPPGLDEVGFCCFEKFKHPILVEKLKTLTAQIEAANRENEGARKLLAHYLNTDPEKGLYELIGMVKRDPTPARQRIIYRAQNWVREHAMHPFHGGADLALYHAVLSYEHELDEERHD